jgi:hypothetical protein
METIGEAIARGLMHGAYVGLSGDRTRAIEMRQAAQERWLQLHPLPMLPDYPAAEPNQDPSP